MLELFTTDKHDYRIALFDGEVKYTISDLKKMVASEINHIKTLKDNIIIFGEDNFSFIVQFLAALFCNKNIYILNEKSRLNTIDIDYDIPENYFNSVIDSYEFPEVDIYEPRISFYTSGSSGVPKIIRVSFYNLITEAYDICEEYNLFSKNYSVMSSTSLCHHFGLTFHFLVPMIAGLTINTRKVVYPEDVDCDDVMLITTPTFLNYITKFGIMFKIPPKLILSAGSKLDCKVFENMEKYSNVIDIYGSTETGVIAYRRHSNDDFRLYKNVNIKGNGDNVEVISAYFYKKPTIIKDMLEINNDLIKIKSRTDRLFKIYDKRVSADELEMKLKANVYVSDCYIIQVEDKLGCVCVLSDQGKEFVLKSGVPELTGCLKNFLLKYSEIVPQKWRYMDEIPMTQIGKVNKQFIQDIFNTNLSLPVMFCKSVVNNSVIYRMFFYRQCNFFNGHFPNFEIVPGVVQMYYAKMLACLHFNIELGEGQWKRIKFSNIILPDDVINLRLEKTDKHVQYEFYSDNKVYSSGVFLCENVFSGVCK